MSENWFRYGAFPPNHRPLTCSALLSSMLKSNCKVLTLPVQRKQTPYASCPVVRKSFLSWYLYYDHDSRKYQLGTKSIMFLYQVLKRDMTYIASSINSFTKVILFASLIFSSDIFMLSWNAFTICSVFT